MLLGFSVTNHRCFVEEARISFARPELRTQTPREGQSWQDVTYRVAAIYGANASGKSTLLDALATLSAAVGRPGRNLYEPFGLSIDGGSEPTVYDVNFTHGGVRYHYEVEAWPWGIGWESLHSYPHGTRRHLFTRTQERGSEIAVWVGGGLTGPTTEVRKVTTPRSLFLASASRYGHRTLAPVAEGLRFGSAVSVAERGGPDRVDRMRWIVAQIVEDPENWQETCQALVRMADLGVERVELEDGLVPEVLGKARSLAADGGGDEGGELPEDLVRRLCGSLVFVHEGPGGQGHRLGLAAQSEGTVAWLASVGPALRALRRGGLLIADELDASLHPALVAALVDMFKDPSYNATGAQLLFTTHDSSLLGNSPSRLLEPGEVWFCEKKGGGASRLVSLSEYDTRPTNNEQKRYLAGKFGAIPRVDLSGLLDCGFGSEPTKALEVS